MTIEEAKKFLKHINKVKNEPARHPIRILIFTGLRRSEVLGIERSDVDLDKMTFKAVNIKSRDKHKTKRGFPKQIWSDFRFFLEKSNSKYPFKVYEENYFSSLVKKYMREMGLPDFHTHSLRHTFITLSIENGSSIRSAQKFVDHRSIQTTESYSHDVSEEIPKINIE